MPAAKGRRKANRPLGSLAFTGCKKGFLESVLKNLFDKDGE
tara:strand:+ start:294 stop:416 length:123 start_codon:yes stop_codon:yes gene_type:complete